MGFFDSLKDALGGDHHDRDDAAVDSTAPLEQPRHVDPHAAESDGDAAVVTGGKHAARD